MTGWGPVAQCEAIHPDGARCVLPVAHVGNHASVGSQSVTVAPSRAARLKRAVAQHRFAAVLAISFAVGAVVGIASVADSRQQAPREARYYEVVATASGLVLETIRCDPDRGLGECRARADARAAFLAGKRGWTIEASFSKVDPAGPDEWLGWLGGEWLQGFLPGFVIAYVVTLAVVLPAAVLRRESHQVPARHG